MRKNRMASFLLVISLLLFVGCSPESGQQASPGDNEKVEVNGIEIPMEDANKKDDVPKVANNEAALTKMLVHYIDVGQGDATLVQFSDGTEDYAMLIDTGNWNSSEVVSYLHAQGVKDISIIAITHPHADHIGQLSLILNEFNVDEVWMNGETTNSGVFLKALETIEDKAVDYYEPEAGDVFDIGPLEVAVLHPKSLSGDTNNNSIAMRLQYGEISFLFTGDGEKQAESELLASGANLTATILHLGHHGSNTSTGSDFLKAVNPQVAIYSAGIDNSYGHPDADITHRIKAFGAQLYGTDTEGTILVETDGKTFKVRSQKDGTISPSPVKLAGNAENEIISKEQPAPADKSEPQAVPEEKLSTGSCIDINTATEAEIQRIKHIGPERAKDLIQLRPFSSAEDLGRIKGIGPARINDIISQGLACTGG